MQHTGHGNLFINSDISCRENERRAYVAAAEADTDVGADE
jgi:hypothetical protein